MRRDGRFITDAEIAEDLHVSKMTVYRLIHRGDIASIRVGRSFRVPREAYDEFVYYPHDEEES